MALDARRKYPRIKSENIVHVANATAEDSRIARTKELGSRGCLIKSSSPFGCGRVLILRLGLGVKTIRAFGKVLYEYPDGHGAFLSGFEFISVFPEDINLLNQFIADRLSLEQSKILVPVGT
jgi:hypothetical protein